MSDKSAGQEGPTPDFIPGWFAPRDGNPDPAVREAVRIPDPGDFFPITFLRSTERVSPSQRPQLGFTVGATSQPGHVRFDLAVPPGYWIVRDADGKLYNWRDEDFKAKYRRSERDWTPPVERDVPSGRPAAAERVTLTEPKTASEIGRSASEVDAERRDQLRYVEGWQGTPPAEGTRRKLILDTLEDFSARLISGVRGKLTGGSCLDAADAIEEALLRVVDQGATPESGSPASVAMDVLDGLGVGRTRDGAILTIADRVTVVADELVERRREMVRSGEKLDEISIPRTSDDAGGSEGATTLTLNERVYLAVKRVLVEEEAKRLLANTVNAQQTAMDRFKAQRDEARALPAPTPTNDEHIDEFTLTLLACERLHERLTDGPVPNPAELARVIDILR